MLQQWFFGGKMFNVLKTLRRFQKCDVLETLPRPFKILGTPVCFFLGKERWDLGLILIFPLCRWKVRLAGWKWKYFSSTLKEKNNSEVLIWGYKELEHVCQDDWFQYVQEVIFHFQPTEIKLGIWQSQWRLNQGYICNLSITLKLIPRSNTFVSDEAVKPVWEQSTALLMRCLYCKLIFLFFRPIYFCCKKTFEFIFITILVRWLPQISNWDLLVFGSSIPLFETEQKKCRWRLRHALKVPRPSLHPVVYSIC